MMLNCIKRLWYKFRVKIIELIANKEPIIMNCYIHEGDIYYNIKKASRNNKNTIILNNTIETKTLETVNNRVFTGSQEFAVVLSID